jgi:signal transduction histidine kinase
MPVSLPISGGWRSAVAALVDANGILDARLFLVDPERPRRREARLAVLAALVRQVTPALLSLYLLRRLRSRAGLRERARLSAELHDGLIQTLTALEMRLELLRRGAGATDATVAAEVASARDLLHEEALRARELMERLRPVEGDVDRFPSDLAGMIRRFSGTSGLDARLDWAGDTLDLTPRQCREVLRIVQEALVNVRRHSGASQVVVRLTADEYDWVLAVEDDGRGLGLTGRLTHDQIDREQTGPRVIRQRVAALGGTLNIESSPAGLRLEVAWPRARRM